jgi:hypothetical protein
MVEMDYYMDDNEIYMELMPPLIASNASMI